MSSSTANPQTRRLFGMIRHTQKVSGAGTSVAYKDNASVMAGRRITRWLPGYPDAPARMSNAPTTSTC